LEAALRASGLSARVHNGGVSGDTSAVGWGRLDWVIDSLKAKPDLVIIELGGNDMLRGLGPDQTLANLDAMITALRKKDVPVLLAGMRASPNLGKAYQAKFDAIYPTLAKRHAVTLYPFFMDGVAAQLPLLQSDGIHPNAKGVEIIVGKMLPVVKAALDK
jgi:acyl-CoA thioesterase I